MNLNDRRWQAAGAAGAVALAAAGIVGITLLISGNSQQPPVRARQYTASQACLLTGSRGITGPPASTVWAGMEDASLATHAKVTYLSAEGPATASNATPFANTLIQRHCDVILAVGAPQVDAISQLAPHTPESRFVIVSNGTTFARANLTTISLTADTRGEVKQAVEDLVNG